LAAAGCAPPPNSVYVDVARVMRETALPPLDKPAAVRPPTPMPGVTSTVPGRTAQQVQDRPRASGAEVRGIIEESQRRAQQDLERALRRFYQREFDRFQLAEQRDQALIDADAYILAQSLLRQRFEEWADQRLPVFSRLTLLAGGFPDPNPLSLMPDPPPTPARMPIFQETLRLRALLSDLDAEFDQNADAIFDQVRDQLGDSLVAMRLRIEAFRADLDRRAAEQAAAQIRATTAELGLQLIEPLDLRLPGTAPLAARIPAEEPFRPAPQVPSEGILQGPQDREKLARHEIGIWTSLNRLRLVDSPRGARDRTDEFLEWRRKFEVGR
jgi:hypothetical protein